MNVSPNADQRLYVIAGGDGCSCLGFDNARDHAGQIAGRLDEPALAFGDGDHGTLQGYSKYRAAIEAWGHSRLKEQTYFDPATDPQVARDLERCRHDRRTVRLKLGDTDTGCCWLDEFHVVGRIGRSTGMLKVPLLIEGGASGGVAILTSCVLRIVDWRSGRDLYRHPAYRAPDLEIRRATEDPAWKCCTTEWSPLALPTSARPAPTSPSCVARWWIHASFGDRRGRMQRKPAVPP